MPEDRVLAPTEALAEAERLLAVGAPFSAHEVLETVWKSAPAAERALWQGLAQLAVGLTHAQRGNAAGAVQLLDRGRTLIEPYADGPPYGIAVRRLVRDAGALVARIRSSGLLGLEAGDLRVRLTQPGP